MGVKVWRGMGKKGLEVDGNKGCEGEWGKRVWRGMGGEMIWKK